ncbi:MAG TPA: DUF488 domain-containing protein [Actinomycetota bacterium]|nr:DUF488 domain-containing protein [Actinomycetota bacterium]
MIFTIGHGTRPIEEFLAILDPAGIRRLVDVRTAPGSRRHPQFGRDVLATSLESQAIEYVWRKELGGFRTPRVDSPHVAIRNDAFRGYADYMETEEFRSALSWLIHTSRDTPTAIMCAESLWWRCHRRMISDALTVAGCEVVHLLDGGRREPHRLHPSARVDGSRLIYDVRTQQALAP